MVDSGQLKTIARIIRDVPVHWVGDGFPVRSLFSYQEGNAFDPFLLLDYGGPYAFTPVEHSRGVGEHPHRGFETVTIVYQGKLQHRDSCGNVGVIGPEDVQWMTAASGVVHEEFHSDRFAREGGVLEMVQLWINLPAKDKMSPPRYQEIIDSRVPRMSLPNNAGMARVIAGELLGSRGPAKTFSTINVWDLLMVQHGETELHPPDGHTCLLVVQSGELNINGISMEPVELALFDRRGGAVALKAMSAARVLILTGKPLGESVVGEGPFVMNTREEISEAIKDYRSGKMGQLNSAKK